MYVRCPFLLASARGQFYIYIIKTIVLRSRIFPLQAPSVSLGRQFFNWAKLQGAEGVFSKRTRTVPFQTFTYLPLTGPRRRLIIPFKAEVKSFSRLSLARVYDTGGKEYITEAARRYLGLVLGGAAIPLSRNCARKSAYFFEKRGGGDPGGDRVIDTPRFPFFSGRRAAVARLCRRTAQRDATFRFVSFRFVSFRFISFRFVSFRFVRPKRCCFDEGSRGEAAFSTASTCFRCNK